MQARPSRKSAGSSSSHCSPPPPPRASASASPPTSPRSTASSARSGPPSGLHPPLLLRIPTAAAGYNTHALGRRDRPLQSSLGGFMEERGLSTTPGPRHRDVLRTLGPQVCHPSNRRQIGQSYESCSKHGLSSTMMALITSGIVAACSSVRATSPCPSPAWRTAPPTTPRTSTRSSWSCRLGTGELCHTP